MTVLSVLLWILFGLLLLLLLLLLIPLRAEFRFNTEAELVLRYLFLCFKILPAAEDTEDKKEKKKKQKEPKEEKESGEKKPSALGTFRAALRAEGFSGFMEILGRFMGLTGTLVWELIRALRVKTVDLCVVAGGKDAAAAAVLFGQASALVYGAVGAFCKLVDFKDPKVTVDLDYQADSPSVQCEVHLAVTPIRAVFRALQYLFGIIPLVLRFQRSGRRGSAMRRGTLQSGKEAKIQ